MTLHYRDDQVTLWQGDALEVARTLDAGSVDCCVTSPPYYGLRDYNVPPHDWDAVTYTPMAGLPAVEVPAMRCALGLEPDPAAYVAHLVALFREIRRVLADDGTLWLNLGDSYYSGRGNPGPNSADGKQPARRGWIRAVDKPGQSWAKPKDLLLIPHRVALALQADGWTLRNDNIWCLSGGAWVYARTTKGDMPVMLKDLVRLNPATVKLWNGEKWTQVLGWGPSNDTEERIEIVLRSGERIGSTGKHEWPTARGLIRTRDLRLGDVIATCELPDVDSEAPRYLTDDVLWLVGLYLAEGSHSGKTTQLSLHTKELEWVPRIRKAIEHLGGRVAHHIYGNSLCVQISSKVFAAVLDTYIGGRICSDKHFKVSVWALPNRAIRLMIEGYLDGDGGYDALNDRWRLGFTRNYALERDLRVAAARLGASLTLHPRMGKHPCFHGEWRWNKTQHHNTKDRGEVVELRKSRARRFWDVAVADEPHLFALASGVLTHNCKPNGMPESVTDRLSSKHEHVFLFSKSARYWFDLDPIREQLMHPDAADGSRVFGGANKAKELQVGSAKRRTGNRYGASRPWANSEQGDDHDATDPRGRNPGDVWSIPTTPFPGAHFACMPRALAERCILAGCPPRRCAVCGHAPTRSTERVEHDPGSRNTWNRNTKEADVPGSTQRQHRPRTETRAVPAGWTDCGHNAYRAGAVLDPFSGSGTTGLAAARHGRRYVGIDLNSEYLDLSLRTRLLNNTLDFTGGDECAG